MAKGSAYHNIMAILNNDCSKLSSAYSCDKISTTTTKPVQKHTLVEPPVAKTIRQMANPYYTKPVSTTEMYA